MILKYKIGTRIKHKDKYDEYVHGHVVLYIDGYYYCDMYPGAMPNYEWVHCIDLNSGIINEEGDLLTLHTLNKFKEIELEFADIKLERKLKLKKLNEN